MATREDIYAAIKNADAAGDSESVQKLGAYLQTMKVEPEAPKESTFGSRLKQQTSAIAGEAKDLVAGVVRGAGSIGNTGIAIGDAVQEFRGMPTSGRTYAERKTGMDDALQTMGADPNSLSFKTGKLGGEIAGTAGAGGILAGGAKAVGVAPKLVNALRTNGFATGAPGLTAADALATRTLGGALAGGAQVGLASPEHAGTGALIGGALPGALKVLGAAGSLAGDAAQGTSQWLMKSALKGTAKMHSKGDVDTAVQTLLDYGINPTPSGVNKLKGLIGEMNEKISSAIENSTAKIDKQKVLNALASSRERFGNQPAPTKDLNTIQGVADDFIASHPDQIPIQLAQKLKQGGNRLMRDKYGQLGTAEEAATKDLTRGLKEGIAEAAPEVAPLNAAESRLLATLKVAERRAMMDANKDPTPLAAGLALASGEPSAALALIANSKAWGKSMAARGLNALSRQTPNVNALAGPGVYRALPGAGRN